MSAGSKIEWTDNTWNVVTGCTRVSPACDRCYIEKTPPFRMERRKFDGDRPGSTTGVRLHPDRLDWPLTRWKNKPARIFTCSLADIFHEDVPDDFLADVFGVMAHARQHTFQVLTKRHARMRSLLSSEKFIDSVADRILRDDKYARARWAAKNWPLPNVWLGVTAENQDWFDTRVHALASTPAAVRFVSAEPLLGPIDPWIYAKDIDWLITGGETGPGARPTHPDWFTDLRDACVDKGVPFFFKQWGDWAPGGQVAHVSGYRPDPKVRPQRACVGETDPLDWHTEMLRVGKKVAGRELDGRTWDEFPAVAS